MRPVKLEIEGFTAFRNKTTVEFDGVETFVLSGPTGSGKSSVIDAITFALYGSVPRYNDTKLVHPIISQGLMEAKVRFDFQVGGTNYTAVRIVKNKRKATHGEQLLKRRDLNPATGYLLEQQQNLTNK